MTWLEFRLNGEKVNVARFPITEVGDNSTVVLEVVNTAEGPVELQPSSITNENVTLEQYPKSLQQGQSGIVSFHFNAPQDMRKPLETGITFREILG